MKKYDMINKNKLTLLSVSLVGVSALFLAGCGWFSSKKEEVAPGLVVINVLDKDYFDDCHITGSINVPFDDLEKKISSLNKQSEYVVYCSNYACTAAPHSAKMLKDADFDQVSVYHGGIVEWHQKGYPCTGPAQKEYLKEANEPMDDEDHSDDMVSVTADELKTKMIEAGLLS